MGEKFQQNGCIVNLEALDKVVDEEVHKKYKGYCQPNNEDYIASSLFKKAVRDFLNMGICANEMSENHLNIVRNLKTGQADDVAAFKWIAYLINKNPSLARDLLNNLEDKKNDKLYKDIHTFMNCRFKIEAFVEWSQLHNDFCKQYNEKYPMDNFFEKDLTIFLADIIRNLQETSDLTSNKKVRHATPGAFAQFYVREHPTIERLFNGKRENNFIYLAFKFKDRIPPEMAYLNSKSRHAAWRFSKFTDPREGAQQGIIQGAIEELCMNMRGKKELTRTQCERIVMRLFNLTNENYISLQEVSAAYLIDPPAGYDKGHFSDQLTLKKIKELFFDTIYRTPLKEVVEKGIRSGKYPNFQITNLRRVLKKEIINFSEKSNPPTTQFKNNSVDLKGLIQCINAEDEEGVKSLLGKISQTIVTNINGYYDQRTPLGAALEAGCNCKIIAGLMARGARYDIPQLSHFNQTIQRLFWDDENQCSETRTCVIPQSIDGRPKRAILQIDDRSCGDKVESLLSTACEEDTRLSTDVLSLPWTLPERMGIESGLGMLSGFTHFMVEKLMQRIEQRCPEYKDSKRMLGLNLFLSSILNAGVSLPRYFVNGAASFLVDDEDTALISSLMFYSVSTMGFTLAISTFLFFVNFLCRVGYLPKCISPLLFSFNVLVFFTSKDFQENPGPAGIGCATNVLSNNLIYWALHSNFFSRKKPLPTSPDDYELSVPLAANP
ncbi:MAG: hypothetical protein V4700_01295 [Pseudomonadota bacterium]